MRINLWSLSCLLLPLRLFAEEPPTELWSSLWDGPGAASSNGIHSLNTLDGGMVAVTQTYSPQFFHDRIGIQRRSALGELEWELLLDDSMAVFPFRTGAFQLDADEGVLGSLVASPSRALHVFRLHPDGELDWNLELALRGGPNSQLWQGPVMRRHQDGRILIAAPDSTRYHVAMLDHAGSLLWNQGFEIPGSSWGSHAFPTDLAWNSAAGQIAVVGFGGSTANGFHTLCLDESGSLLWERNHHGDIETVLGGARAAWHTNGELSVSGITESSFGVPHLMMWRFTSTGDSLWRWRPGPATDVVDQAGIQAMPDGSVLLGAESSFENGTGMMAARVGSDGQTQWQRYFRPEGITWARLNSSLFSSEGDVLLCGHDGSAVNQYFIKLDASGDSLWSFRETGWTMADIEQRGNRLSAISNTVSFSSDVQLKIWQLDLPLLEAPHLDIRYLSGQLTLEWQPVEGATAYRVYQVEGLNNPDPLLLAETAETQWSLPLGADSMMFYKVLASDQIR